MLAWYTILFLCAAGLGQCLPSTSPAKGLDDGSRRTSTLASGEWQARDSKPFVLSSRGRIPAEVCDRGRGMLRRLSPGFSGGEPTVNEVIHSLRLWGGDTTHRCEAFSTGVDSLKLLLESDRFARQWPDAEGPLISSTARGLAVRSSNGVTEAAHRNQLLAAMGEAGVSLEASVELVEREGSVREILEEALSDFSLNKRGLEWTAVAFALYLPPQTSWRTTVGKVVSFDDVARRLMDGPAGGGTCLGQHRLYALVVLLQVDGQTRILSPGTRRRILEWLSAASQMLADSQYSDGSWPARWDQDWASTQGEPDPVEIRLRVTTHALEWWALAPEEVLPAPEVIDRAVAWVTSVVETLDEAAVQASYDTLSHGGRALRLWMEGLCSP